MARSQGLEKKGLPCLQPWRQVPAWASPVLGTGPAPLSAWVSDTAKLNLERELRKGKCRSCMSRAKSRVKRRKEKKGHYCSFSFLILIFFYLKKKKLLQLLALGSPLFTLCISPIFSLLPMSLCCASNPLYIPQSFEKVGVFFSFLLSLPTFLHSATMTHTHTKHT